MNKNRQIDRERGGGGERLSESVDERKRERE